nr:ORF1 [Anelloviridae sp.]
MAITWRFRRRANYKRWRPTTWRRRYRRTAPIFRRRQRKVRTRHHKWFNKPHREPVKQWTPKNIKQCKIKGWAPLFLGTYARRYYLWDTKDTTHYTGGGIGQVFFTLGRLYNEHVKHRNWWTETNEGTDLCQYKGTKIYFQPNEKYSYIVHWDREYGNEDTFPIWMYHPALMMLNPQHKIIWSKEARGNRGPTKVWMPPPAVTTNEWYFQKLFVNYGLFGMTATLFDPVDTFMTENQANYKMKFGFPTNLWTPTTTDIQEVNYHIFDDDCVHNKIGFNQNPWSSNTDLPGHDDTQNKMIYWGEGYPYWISSWGFEPSKVSQHPAQQGIKNGYWIWILWYPPQNDNDPTPKKDEPKRWTPLSREMLQALQGSGPFVQHQYDANFSFYFKYTSYWRWGGLTPDVTSQYNEAPQAGVAPTTSAKAHWQRAQVHVRNPATIHKEIIHPWDIKGEKILQHKWAQLTSISPEHTLHETLNTGRKSTETEPLLEEDEELWTSEEEEKREKDLQKLLRRLIRRL